MGVQMERHERQAKHAQSRYNSRLIVQRKFELENFCLVFYGAIDEAGQEAPQLFKNKSNFF